MKRRVGAAALLIISVFCGSAHGRSVPRPMGLVHSGQVSLGHIANASTSDKVLATAAVLGLVGIIFFILYIIREG
jgi:hypothetical protein